MKTKHILTALVLPAMFAACTADDVVSMNEMQQANRATLSKSFVLNTNTEVESRYAVEGSSNLKFSFEEGDMIGANLIDQYLPGEKNPAKWPIVYSVNPALPFKNTGLDQWKSDSELGVGNYLFTYPYNAKDNNRAAAIYELPLVQDLTDGNLNAVIEANNKAVGATVLKEGQVDATVSMKNLFTYPKFILKFAVGQSLKKVNKVVLSGNFLVKGGYNHKKIAALFANDYAKFAAETSTELANKLWEVEEGATYNEEKHSLNWDLVQTNDLLIAGDEADYETNAKLYGEAISQSNIAVELNQNVKTDADGNKYVEVRIMMPSVESYLDSEMKIYAFADNGVYTFNFNTADFEFKSTTSAVAKKTALYRSRTNTLTFAPITSKPDASKAIVTTISDWNKLVATYGADKEGDQEISIVGNAFAFDETAEMPSKATFTIESGIFAIDGKVALKNVVTTGDITVTEDGELTIDKTVVAKNIINKGILNIADEADILKIENEGTLNVGAKGKLFAGVESRTETASVKVVNEGIMNVAEGGDVKAAIDNLGELNISGYVNAIVVNGKENAKKSENEKAIITMGATEKAILKGNVTNHKYAKINTAKDATAVVANNQGEVKFVDGADLTAAGGTISYESAETSFGAYYFVDEDSEGTDKYSINKLILTKDATFAGTATGKAVDFSGKTIVLKDGVDITVTKGHTLTVGTLEVEGKSEIAKDSKINVTNLNVLEGADLINKAEITAAAVEVEKKAYLTVGAKITTETFANNGTVTNNSTVVVREGELTGKGSWSGDNFTTKAGYAQEDYEEALYNYVAKWAKGYATVENGWDGIVEGIITDCPVAWSMTEVAEDLLEKYNGYKLDEDDEELELTQANMKSILEAAAEEDVEELQAAVAALKTAVEAELKSVLTAKVAETDEDGELVFTVDMWNADKTGYATLGGEKKNQTLALKPMWEAYVTYLKSASGIASWEVTTNNVVTTPYKNHDNALIRTYQLALNSIVDAAHMTGSYVNASGTTVEVIPANPDLAIPAGSYINASSKTGAAYVVVNAWTKFELSDDAPAAFAEVAKYTLASFAKATNPSRLNYIQNWCYELNRVEAKYLDMEQSKVKTAISSFVNTVVNVWEAPEYSEHNLSELIEILPNN